MSESTSGTLAGDHFVPQLKCERHGFAVYPAAWDMRLCPWCKQEERVSVYFRQKHKCCGLREVATGFSCMDCPERPSC